MLLVGVETHFEIIYMTSIKRLMETRSANQTLMTTKKDANAPEKLQVTPSATPIASIAQD